MMRGNNTFVKEVEIWVKDSPPGRALNFFSGTGVRPGFLKCGACELIFVSEKGVLWTEIFKFEGLRAEILAKIKAVGAKVSKFSSKGVLWTDF